MIYFNILCIAVFWTVALDMSGFVDDFKGWITKLVLGHSFYNWNLKPFFCSFCMTFWTAITYIIIVGQFTLFNITYSILMALATQIILEVLNTIINLILKLCNYLQKKS